MRDQQQKRVEEEEENRRVTLGVHASWGAAVPLTLAAPDRRRHLYVVGVTGSGKTTLLRNLIAQDLAAGAGVGVIDPHGDLAEDVLDLVPPWRTDHVALFDPADAEHPPAMNLLAGVPPGRRHLAVSGIVGAMKGVWRDSWGPRLEYLLGNAVAALVEAGGETLLGIGRMFTDERYRARIVGRVKDPVVRGFWERELAGWDRRFLAEAASPIQNKVGQLLLSPPVRNVLGQTQRKIDLQFVMDDRRIFIANLAKGRLGPDKSSLLGALLVSQFELAALTRADRPESGRADFYLYVDEFFNFATDGFASLLAEARKYRLNLTLAHQYLGQLAPPVRDAVFGNAGSIAAFRVGGEDAEAISRACGGTYSAATHGELGRHEAVLRYLDGDGHQRAVRGKTLPPAELPRRRAGHRGRIVARSRERFTTPRKRVEERIERWIGPIR